MSLLSLKQVALSVFPAVSFLKAVKHFFKPSKKILSELSLTAPLKNNSPQALSAILPETQEAPMV